MTNIRKEYVNLYKMVDTLLVLSKFDDFDNPQSALNFEKALSDVEDAILVNKELYHKAARNE
jgi:hypothetical protein